MGATMVVGAAVASVNAAEDPVTSADTTADFPAIREKRSDAADDVSRRPSAKATPKPTSDAPASEVGVNTPKPKPKPTANPDPAPAGARIPPIPGCDAVIPAEGTAANGELDDENLCDLGNGHRLRPDAAASFVALAEEYGDQTGSSLLECVTDSYRSYDIQVELKLRKPYLAARPGTSNHGWGVAVDLACGANSFESPLHDWLEENGDEYGWTNPEWAQPTGSKPEPWHWEYSTP